MLIPLLHVYSSHTRIFLISSSFHSPAINPVARLPHPFICFTVHPFLAHLIIAHPWSVHPFIPHQTIPHPTFFIHLSAFLFIPFLLIYSPLIRPLFIPSFLICLSLIPLLLVCSFAHLLIPSSCTLIFHAILSSIHLSPLHLFTPDMFIHSSTLPPCLCFHPPTVMPSTVPPSITRSSISRHPLIPSSVTPSFLRESPPSSPPTTVSSHPHSSHHPFIAHPSISFRPHSCRLCEPAARDGELVNRCV